MPGIPDDVYTRLETALFNCGPFNSDYELTTVFTNELIYPWRNRVPQAGNRTNRVRATIEALHDQFNAVQENALVLLLRVLSDQTDSNTACYHTLAALAQELEVALAAVTQPSVPPSPTQLATVDAFLARIVPAYEAQMYRRVARVVGAREQPYKFLYAFELEDANIFFGREEATKTLQRTVLKDRLAILHAKSGAGKTSLLNAGLSPRLIREGRLPVYARAYQDPVQAIKRAIASPAAELWPQVLSQLSLHAFLTRACGHLSRQTQELVIILDQFEEFFIFWPEREHRQRFIYALTECYEDKTLPLRFVIGIRSDYFSHLATFQECLPHIFYNEYYLRPMTREEARMAIVTPLTQSGQPVTYEQSLLDALLNDLSLGGMELPHLQIVCTRLFDMLPERTTILSMDLYETLGRAAGVLGNYLNKVLNQLPAQREVIAREMLKALISVKGTKRALSWDSLIKKIDAEETELDAVLEHLLNARLLFRDEAVGQVKYELAHEYLVEEIMHWMSREDLLFKQMQEFLMREVTSWHDHNILIPEERLALLYPYRERFENESEEAKQCLLKSSLHAASNVEDWAELAGKSGEKLLIEALSDVRIEIRWAALRSLGKLWEIPKVSDLGKEEQAMRRDAAVALRELDNPHVVDVLLIALRDLDDGVRRIATQSLAHVWSLPQVLGLGDADKYVRRKVVWALNDTQDPRVLELLIAALHDEAWDVRHAVARTLGELGEPRSVMPLIETLHDNDSMVRYETVEALGKLRDIRAVEILVQALTDRSHTVRQAAATALGQLGAPDAIAPLINALQDVEEYVRQAAAESLSKIGNPAVEPLITALQHQSKSVRWTVANVLGEIGNSVAIEPLISVLADNHQDVRQAAAKALGKLPGIQAVNPLIHVLQHDEDDNVRRAAARSLGDLGSSWAVKPLIALLENENSDMRQEVVVALGKLKAPQAVDALIPLLQDKNMDVRQRTLEALTKINTPYALTAVNQ